MSKKTVNEVTLNTLEAQGKALAVEWKSIERGLKASFTKHTKADGFDTRLGNLMVALKAEGGERISSARLKECGVNSIDKRRRSEALWFVENETACRDFVKKSKRGFTSLTALQAAMRQAAKAAEAKSTEGEAKSNVGPKQPKAETQPKAEAQPVAKRLEADDIVVQVLDLMEANSVTLEEFEAAFNAIKEIAKTEDTNKEAA
jgi:hypothetical protein